MTDKETYLGRIKGRAKPRPVDRAVAHLVTEADIAWLISRAERAAELEALVSTLSEQVDPIGRMTLDNWNRKHD